MKQATSYLICCLPRTGSWLLSEELQSTGIAGRPREYFAPEAWQHFLDVWNMPPASDYSDFLSRVVQEATTPNGVWGAKAHWYQFNDLLQKLRSVPAYKDLPTESLLPRVFPNLRYVYLTRRDRVRHAVSYARASETKIWWEMDPARGPSRRVLAKTPKFDIARLDGLFKTLSNHSRFWRQYFQECGVSPLRIDYEDLAKDPAASVRQILDYLEIPAPLNLVIKESRLKKQADELSEAWVQRYRHIKDERRPLERRRA